MKSFKNFKLRTKMIFSILLILFLSFSAILIFTSSVIKDKIKEYAFENIKSTAEKYGSIIDADIEVSMDTCRTLSDSFEGLINNKVSDRNIYTHMLKSILQENQSFLAVWIVLEPNILSNDSEFVNKDGSNEKGRYADSWYRSKDNKLIQAVSSEADILSGDWYKIPKEQKEECVIEPYMYSYTGNKNDETLMITVVVPIIEDKEFLGIVGIDISADVFQNMVTDFNIYGSGYGFLVSNKGNFISHKNTELIGKNIGIIDPESEQKYNVLQNIKSGKEFYFTKNNSVDGQQSYTYFTKINIGNSKEPLAFGISVPVNKALEKVNSVMTLLYIICGVILLISIIIAILIANSIAKPVSIINKTLKDIANGQGDLTVKLPVNSEDEIGELALSFNQFIEMLEAIISDIRQSSERVASFSTELSAGMKNIAQSSQEQASEISSLQGHAKKIKELTSEVTDNVQSQMASLEETSSAMSEISETTNSVAKNAEVTMIESNLAQDAALQGKADVNKTLEGMKNIEKLVGSIEMSLEKLGNITIKGINESVDSFGNITIKEIGENVEKFGNITIRSIEDKAVKLGESSEKIGDILKIIESIAEQTNLLALNAAIEAAHAGDAGRGFAVVADEIKALAERSQKSTKEIDILTKNIKKDVTNVIEETKTGYTEVQKVINTTKNGYKEVQKVMEVTKVGYNDVQKVMEDTRLGYQEVKNGLLLATEAEQKLQLIVDKNKILSTEISNVAKAMEEQSTSSNEVASAMSSIAQNGSKIEDLAREQLTFTEEFVSSIINISESIDINTSSTEEVATSADELSNIAETLRELVSQFKIKSDIVSTSKEIKHLK